MTITDEELEKGLELCNQLGKLMDEQAIFDNRGVKEVFHQWVTPERVASILQELRVWRMVHQVDLQPSDQSHQWDHNPPEQNPQ